MSPALFSGVESISTGENSRAAHERILMNARNISKGLLLGASLFFASSAFAGEKVSVKVYDDVKVNGKTLTAGKYEVEWDGTGSQVQVNFRQGKDTVATVPATITPTKVAQSSTGYSTSREQDGSLNLTAVVIAGKKYTIQLGQQEASAPAKSETAGNR
jgi:hypothetical protein